MTTKIRLYAWTAVLILPPAIVARMTATIADVFGSRFGVIEGLDVFGAHIQPLMACRADRRLAA